MTWVDRLREAAYNSPSGTRVLFDFEDVSRSFDKKTSAYEFPDADGTYIQDLGVSGRRYPLRIFFWGADHDLQAADFDAALQERGTGRLEHPFYGVVDVVPFGTVSQRDDLKTAANQTIFEVTFWATTGLVYPTAQTDPGRAVSLSIVDFNAAQAADFEDTTQLETPVEQATVKNNYLALLDTTSSALEGIAEAQDNVRSQFDAIVDSINLGIDTLIAQPLTLALQTIQLVQAPARAGADIQARLDAYARLTQSIIEDGDAETSNQFHTRDLYSSSYVTGSILSTLNTQFETKAGALTAAERILAQFESVAAWRDDNYRNLDEIDTGAAYQALQRSAALAAGFLVEISFSLKQERRITLDRDRTIVDLAAELYGSVDDQLDFLINSNNLTGSEILELPKGREIVFYV